MQKQTLAMSLTAMTPPTPVMLSVTELLGFPWLSQLLQGKIVIHNTQVQKHDTQVEAIVFMSATASEGARLNPENTSSHQGLLFCTFH